MIDGERYTLDDERYTRLVEIGRELLMALGDDPARSGLIGTPERFARMWLAFVEGDASDRGSDTTFADASTDQMIVVRGVRVWSFCEHHLLPFWVELTMGYVPTGKILGLSKFGRIARRTASRLSVQERLVREIADDIGRATGSKDVAVIGEGEHLCMVMRGVRQPHRMTTSDLRGAFRENGPARQEFLALAQREMRP